MYMHTKWEYIKKQYKKQTIVSEEEARKAATSLWIVSEPEIAAWDSIGDEHCFPWDAACGTRKKKGKIWLQSWCEKSNQNKKEEGTILSNNYSLLWFVCVEFARLHTLSMRDRLVLNRFSFLFCSLGKLTLLEVSLQFASSLAPIFNPFWVFLKMCVYSWN